MGRKNVCIAWALFLMIALCFPIFYEIYKAAGGIASEDTISAYGFCIGTIIFGTLIICANRNIIKRDYLENEKTPMGFAWKVVAFSAVHFLIIELSTFLITTYFPNAAWTNEQMLEADRAITPFPLFFAAGCVFGPIAEESVFRYALQGGIKRKPWNVIIASLLFGLLHTGFHIEIIVYAVSGLCLGIAYEKTKDINVPICMHVVNNIIATVL